MTNYRRAITAVLMLLFLAGCGQSGPLFIPGDPSTVEPQQRPQQQQQQQQTIEEEDEDDDNGAESP